MNKIHINGPKKSFEISNDLPISFIVGPCVIESKEFILDCAFELNDIFSSLGVNWVFKSSFDKANRSSINSFRGVGLSDGLEILAEVREKVGIPVLTDVHEFNQIEEVSSVVDFLQTPAFLCRQTDFIFKVSSMGKPVNIKKGQFLSPFEVESVLKKASSTGNNNISICERGTFFGYNNLVVDMRSFPIMKEFGFPVVFDATHSVQRPGGLGSSSGGDRVFVETLASAAVSTKISTLFLEAHPNPNVAPCDGPNMIDFKRLKEIIPRLIEIDKIVKFDSNLNNII